jgi:hypothetical protein
MCLNEDADLSHRAARRSWQHREALLPGGVAKMNVEADKLLPRRRLTCPDQRCAQLERVSATKGMCCKETRGLGAHFVNGTYFRGAPTEREPARPSNLYYLSRKLSQANQPSER